MYIYIYVYTYIERERERERPSETERHSISKGFRVEVFVVEASLSIRGLGAVGLEGFGSSYAATDPSP